jgi:hypothetical protein
VQWTLSDIGKWQRGYIIRRILYDLDDDVSQFLKYSWAFTERERGYWTLFMATILLAGILIVFSQLTTTLSILKEINATKYKDLYLTRWTKNLVICHHYRHSDECIFNMLFKSKYAKLKLLWQVNCLHWHLSPANGANGAMNAPWYWQLRDDACSDVETSKYTTFFLSLRVCSMYYWTLHYLLVRKWLSMVGVCRGRVSEG